MPKVSIEKRLRQISRSGRVNDSRQSRAHSRPSVRSKIEQERKNMLRFVEKAKPSNPIRDPEYENILYKQAVENLIYNMS